MVATIDRALGLGITFFDTADAYGPYADEVLVGRALAGPAATRSSWPPSSGWCPTGRTAGSTGGPNGWPGAATAHWSNSAST